VQGVTANFREGNAGVEALQRERNWETSQSLKIILLLWQDTEFGNVLHHHTCGESLYDKALKFCLATWQL
jgi:hypothetical protein